MQGSDGYGVTRLFPAHNPEALAIGQAVGFKIGAVDGPNVVHAGDASNVDEGRVG